MQDVTNLEVLIYSTLSLRSLPQLEETISQGRYSGRCTPLLSGLPPLAYARLEKLNSVYGPARRPGAR